jgi:O-antigen ligase
MNYSPLIKTGLVIAFLTGLAINLSTSIQNIMVAVFLVASVFSPYLRDALRQAVKNGFIRAAVGLYLLLVLGTLWGDAPLSDRLSMLLRSILYLLSPLVYVYFYYSPNVKAFFLGFASCVLLSVLLSILSSLSGLDFFHPSTGIHTQFVGLKIDLFRGHVYQNYFAGLLSAVLLVLLFEGQIKERVHRMVAIALLLLLFVDVFFFVTGRTGHILYVLMVVIIALYYMKRARLRVLAGLLLLMIPITLYLSPHIQDGINRAISDLNLYEAGEANTSIGLRLTFYKNSLMLIERSPLYGHGTGSFRYEYERLHDKVMRSVGNPHSDYLWFAVELGAIGLAGFILFLSVGIWQSLHTPRPYGLLAFVLIITYAVSSVTNSFFTDNITGQFFILALCALMAEGKS